MSERWLNAIWYGGQPAPWWLRIASGLFAGLSRMRSAAYRKGLLRSHRLKCPVVVVGNITVGGTGKTPLVIWLAQRLSRLGVSVGVVLRGYGRREARPALLGEDAVAAEAGDEALLIRMRTGCPVAVGADRVAAAGLLQAAGAQLILADDGLQHLRLARDFEIAVVDGQRGFGNGLPLPAGPLRDPVSRLSAVDLIIQNGGHQLHVPDALRMQVRGAELRSLQGNTAQPLAAWRGRQVHAVAGIGNPARFFDLLRATGLAITEHAFPDHHAFRETDLEFGDNLPVLMTEKDAVKCRAFAIASHWYLPVDAEFTAHDERALLGRLFMDTRLLDILVCPLCKGPLQYQRAEQLLICRAERLAFPIRDGVPVMLEDEARVLPSDDPLLQR